MLYLKENKLYKILDKLIKTVYNANGMRSLTIVWRSPTETYEPCQVRKEAAISRSFCVESSIE